MTVAVWDQIKSNKQFYIRYYRKLIKLLLLSVTLNIVLSGAVAHFFLNRTSSTFYSTSGSTPPVPLIPLNAPNQSSIPLLASDPDEIRESKIVPQ